MSVAVFHIKLYFKKGPGSHSVLTSGPEHLSWCLSSAVELQKTAGSSLQLSEMRLLKSGFIVSPFLCVITVLALLGMKTMMGLNPMRCFFFQMLSSVGFLHIVRQSLHCALSSIY